MIQPWLTRPHWTPPPLHCAVLWNRPAIAEILLDHGADIELRDPDRETTPLRYAIVYCKRDLIPLLLERGANAAATKEGGTTAWQLAVEGVEGAFDEFDDCPSREDYREVANLLEELGVGPD